MSEQIDQTLESAFPLQRAEPVRCVRARLFPYNLATRSPISVVELDSPRLRIGRASSTLPIAATTPPEPSRIIMDYGDGGVEVWGDPSISRDHARIDRLSGEWVLFDELSTNGTYVDGVRVHSCILRDGDRVRIGHTAQFHFCVVHEIVDLA